MASRIRQGAFARHLAIIGDFAWITRDEVEALVNGAGLRISR
jgi:hypothetical protein